MKMLTWTLGILGAYALTVYVLQRSRTWATIALVSERVSYGAREAYDVLRRHEQEKRAQSWEDLAQKRSFPNNVPPISQDSASDFPKSVLPFPKIGPGPDRKPISNEDVIDAVRFAISWLKDQQHRR